MVAWLWLGGLWLAPSHVAAAIACRGTTPATTAAAVPRPANALQNDLLLAQIVWRSAATPSAPAGWTLIRSTTNGDLTQALYFRMAGAAEPASYAWTTDNYRLALITAFSGVDPLAPIIASAAATGGNRTATAPSLNVAVNDAWLVGAFAVASGVNHPFVSTMPECGTGGQTGAGPNGSTIGLAAEALAGTGATGTRSATADTGGGISNQTPNIGTAIALRPGNLVVLHHIRIEHPGSAVTCEPATIVVRACANDTCTVAYPDPVSVTLASSPLGTWSTNPVNVTGQATVTLRVPTMNTVTLSATSTPAALNPHQCWTGSTQTCQLPFADTGFVFSPIPTQVAGATSAAVTLRAVRSAPGNPSACENALAGVQTVQMASQCINPTTCAGRQVSIGATAIANNAAAALTSWTGVTLDFGSNATATFALNYADVGRIRLAARHTVDTGAQLLGHSNEFVVRPADLVIGAVQSADGAVSNPAAADANGAAFIAAGAAFRANVTAVTAAGVAAPNFGREAGAGTVGITSTLHAPAVGAHPPLTGGSVAASAFSAGVATAGGLAWNEVGIIRLQASVADYLATGAVNGSPSTPVGRFVPAHFNVVATDGCAGSGFTWERQPFAVTVTARGAGASMLANYAGSTGFARPVTLAVASGTPAGTLAGASIAAVDFVAGSGTAPAASYAFNPSPQAPLGALLLNATDTDGVSSDPHGSVLGTPLRSGRLRIGNAVGTGLEALSLPLAIESWQPVQAGSSVHGWAPFAGDTCTVLTATDFDGGGLEVEHAQLDAAGSFVRVAPAGSGTYVVTARLDDTPALAPWLQFEWNGDGIRVDPSATVAFGLHPGQGRQIFRREVIGQ